jgi:hypothetical protein
VIRVKYAQIPMAGILALPSHRWVMHGSQWRNRSRIARAVSQRAGVTGFPIYFLPGLRASMEMSHWL